MEECKIQYTKERKSIKGGNKKKLINNLQGRLKKCKSNPTERDRLLFFRFADEALIMRFRRYALKYKESNNTYNAKHAVKFSKTVQDNNLNFVKSDSYINRGCFLFLKFYNLGKIDTDYNHSKNYIKLLNQFTHKEIDISSFNEHIFL